MDALETCTNIDIFLDSFHKKHRNTATAERRWKPRTCRQKVRTWESISCFSGTRTNYDGHVVGWWRHVAREAFCGWIRTTTARADSTSRRRKLRKAKQEATYRISNKLNLKSFSCRRNGAWLKFEPTVRDGETWCRWRRPVGDVEGLSTDWYKRRWLWIS